jgi:fibro-slime domain-containing protein
LALTDCSSAGTDPGSHTQTPQAGSSNSNGGSDSSGGSNTNAAGTLTLGGFGGSSAAGKAGSGGKETDTSGCGDGVLQAAALGETCDDGNSMSGDGCSADCKVIEQGFTCLTPGQKCESTVKCGDSKVEGAETCDDGNDKPKDGCDAQCALEPGWVCPTPGDLCVATKCGDGIIAGVEQCEDDDGATPTANDGCDANCAIEPGYVCDEPGKACRKAVCGDGVAEGGEPCDDKNTVVGDGCSPGCEAEPICTRPSDPDGCSSTCGDGMLLGDEACDDGNKRDGDGCSADCKEEPGYKCDKQVGTLPPTISIPFVFRDFIAFPSQTTTLQRHPDFQARCIGQQQDGMTNPVLDAQGKPLNSMSCNVPMACTLQTGYMDPNGGNCDDHESCVAPDNLNGCKALHGLHTIAGHPGDPFSFWYRTTDGVNKEKVVPTTLTLTNGAYRFESDKLFPLDSDGFVASGDELKRGTHNFGFTTEVRRWFQFDGGELLTFNGDDDVWVYINGKLALDIGGVHPQATRTIRLNANGTVDCKTGEPDANNAFDTLVNCKVPTRDLGLTVGKVYEIALFHAERHSDASNFKLALTGFVSAKSKCAPVCGDGVQTPGEACDDGKNDGSYGGCAAGCKKGPRCGDGTQQMPQEECDDGKNVTPYSPNQTGCAPGCKKPNYCGDMKLDSLFGEECDNGTNDGSYGGCNKDCTLAARCGDGNVDEPQEQCDDGNSVSGDGCSAKCDKEMPK